MTKTLRNTLVSLCMLVAVGSAARGARLVAIGDVHGAYEPLVAILTAAGLIDGELAWAGGDATLLQLGDFTDRGPRVRAVMDLLMRLQAEAPAAGGRVVVLMGNHEALNLVGELRDVSHLTLEEWTTESSAASIEAEYREVVKAGRARARLTGAPRPVFDDAARQTWERTHPVGTLGYLQSLLPDGRYGRWLRELPTAVIIDQVLFLHAGLNPTLGATAPDAINRQVRDEIQRLDACRATLRDEGYLTLSSSTSDLIRVGFAMLDQLVAVRDEGRLDAAQEKLLRNLETCVDYENWHLFAPEGPLWFRGYTEPKPGRTGAAAYGWTEEEGLPRVAAMLEAQGARHVVVAHSPQDDARIHPRFGGRAFLIDTGMLEEVYGGRPSALEIRDGVFTAIYTDGREELWASSRQTEVPDQGTQLAQARTAESKATAPSWRWRGPDGKPLPFRSPEELEDFLRTADVVSSDTIDHGINRPKKVTLERDGVRANAVFRTVSVDQRPGQGPGGKFYRQFRDSFAFEVAAYELARALGLHQIPPAVPRNLEGKEGSLQAWVEEAMTEAKRQEEGHKPPDVLRWARDQVEEQVFDALVNNHDRNAGNKLIDGDWNVWWIDHTRAFQTEHGDERIDELRRITPELYTALRNVERARVQTVLQPFLKPVEIDELFERWDAIVLRFRTLIAQHGPENVLVGF
jgi:hypothetical protein